MNRASYAVFIALSLAGPIAAGADQPQPPEQKGLVKLVSFEDNGSGNSLVVRHGRKRLSFHLPPDGSGGGLSALKKGAEIELRWRADIERRVFRAMRGPCKKRLPRRVKCVGGTLRKVTQGDLGKYFGITVADGKDEEWLATFEPKGNVREKKDAGKKVALHYREKKIVVYVGHTVPGASAAGSASAP